MNNNDQLYWQYLNKLIWSHILLSILPFVSQRQSLDRKVPSLIRILPSMCRYQPYSRNSLDFYLIQSLIILKLPTNPLRLIRMINACVSGLTESSGTHGSSNLSCNEILFFFMRKQCDLCSFQTQFYKFLQILLF